MISHARMFAAFLLLGNAFASGDDAVADDAHVATEDILAGEAENDPWAFSETSAPISDTELLVAAIQGTSVTLGGAVPGAATLHAAFPQPGLLEVTRAVAVDRKGYRFSSESEQTWRVWLAHLDSASVATRDNPVSVFVSTEDDRKRITVHRTETKHRYAKDGDQSESWTDEDIFSTTFLTIPLNDPVLADEVVRLLRQAIKNAPEPEVFRSDSK